MSPEQLRDDAVGIWWAGVRAVDSGRLVRRVLSIDDGLLRVLGETAPLDAIDRVVVLGAGKAGAGMAGAVADVFEAAGRASQLHGWVNVPEDCVRDVPRIRLHGARPAGVNEPTAAGVRGSERILELATSLGDRDVAIVLLSGGGSALLPAPLEGIALADKQEITRRLMHAGATIGELNTVRKQLSRIKGGGLARAAGGARRVWTLVVSDVVGDPLDLIASGPTVRDESTAVEALALLDRLIGRDRVPVAIVRHLERGDAHAGARDVPGNVVSRIIGSNADALDGAAAEARSRGYAVRRLPDCETGIARDIGRLHAAACLRIRDGEPAASPVCLLSGGEPTVPLVATDRPRKGGRNQEVAVAAALALWEDGARDIVVLSGGTDGEDGPTEAAGGIADAGVLERARARTLNPAAHLAINDSHTFLDRAGGLLVTGPTHTNVMDVRVALVVPPADATVER